MDTQKTNYAKKSHLVPLSLSVQRDDYHGWIHQVTVAVEGEVIVFPGYIQHMPAENQNPQGKVIIVSTATVQG